MLDSLESEGVSLIVTNNPLVRERFESVRFVEGGATEVLIAVRDLIHRGHALLSNPLAGSLKPGQTPFRTVLIGDAPGAVLPESVAAAERAVALTRAAPPCPADRHAADLARIDLSLIESIGVL